jgi:hypothetical protein
MSMTFGGTQRHMQSGDEDQRYRLSVVLIAEKRPQYWNFHCCKCTTKLCELSGIVIAIGDTSDMSVMPEYQPTPLSIECKGKWCRFWYEIVTLSGKE